MEDDSLLLEFYMNESAWYATVHTQGINNVTVKSMYAMQTVFRSSPFLQSRGSGRVPVAVVLPLALRSDWISISDDPVELEE